MLGIRVRSFVSAETPLLRLPFGMRSIIVFALPALLAPLAVAPARTAMEDLAWRRHAFDPTSNVAYAANFLADHYTAKRSWAGTVALYH